MPEIIFQEEVTVSEAEAVGQPWMFSGQTEVVVEEEGYLLHTQIPHDEPEEGLWVELHSYGAPQLDDFHDHVKFNKMLGKRVRVTVEILD